MLPILPAKISECEKKVYSALVAIDRAKNLACSVNDKKQTLNDYLKGVLGELSNDTVELHVNIDGKDTNLTMTHTGDNNGIGSWKLESKQCSGKLLPSKNINNYSMSEILECGPPITVYRAKDGNLAFGVDIEVDGKAHTIGGPDKIDLRRIHITNLLKQIQHVEKHGMTHMLNNMSTGCGKSFSQGVWATVCLMAGVNVAFTVPSDTLKTQLSDDLEKVLPNTFLQPIAADNAQRWRVLTHDELFYGQDWYELQNSQSPLMITVDESHLAVSQEMRKRRIERTSGMQNVSLYFLSATPTKTEYSLCNNRAVVSLSAKEKEEQGIAMNPRLIRAEATKIQDSPVAKKQDWRDKLSMILVDAVRTPSTNAAYAHHDVMEGNVIFRDKTHPFYKDMGKCTNKETLKEMMRWNIDCASAGQTLMLTNNHEAIVNLSRLLNDRAYDCDRHVPYDGNIVPTSGSHRFFGNNHDPHEDLYNENIQNLRESKKEQISQYIRENCPKDILEDAGPVENIIDLDQTDAQKREAVVLHGVINLALLFLLRDDGFNAIRLNAERFQDLGALVERVKAKLDAYTNDGSSNAAMLAFLEKHYRLPKNFGTHGANVVSLMKSAISIMLDKDSKLQLKDMVSNWILDKDLHENLRQDASRITHTGQSLGANSLYLKVFIFASKYSTVFVTHGWEQGTTPIESNRPFKCLRESTVPLYKDGILDLDVVKQRKLDTIELLDGHSEQYLYEPEYFDEEFTVPVADSFCLMGLTGLYVNSERSTGFNHPELQRVAMLINDNEDAVNDPKSIIQGVGRARGLDRSQTPVVVIANNKGATVSFNAKALEKGDYIADMHRAIDKHGNVLDTVRVKQMVAKIMGYLKNNVDPSGEADYEAMEEFILQMAFDVFTEIYEQNDHCLKSTKAHFLNCWQCVCNELGLLDKRAMDSRKLALSTRVLQCIITAIVCVYEFFTNKKTCEKFCKDLPQGEKLDLYKTIIAGHDRQESVINMTILRNIQQKMATDIVSNMGHEKFYANTLNDESIEEIRSMFVEFAMTTMPHIVDETHSEALINMISGNEQLTYMAISCARVIENRNIRTLPNPQILLDIISRDKSIKQYIRDQKVTFKTLDAEGILTIGSKMSELMGRFTDLQSSPQNSVNPEKLGEHVAQTVEKYITSREYNDSMAYFFNNLDDKQLTLLLDVIYPNDVDKSGTDNDVRSNAEKARNIKDFIRDSANYNKVEFAAKYYQPPAGSSEYINNNARKIFIWVHDLIDEIYNCQCDFDAVDEKGMSSRESKSGLLISLEGEGNSSTANNSRVRNGNLGEIANMKPYLFGLLDSLKASGRVEVIQNRHIHAQAERCRSLICEPVISGLHKPTKETSALRAGREVGSLFNLTDEQEVIRRAKAFGSLLNKVDSLSEADVKASADTAVPASALEKLRATPAMQSLLNHGCRYDAVSDDNALTNDSASNATSSPKHICASEARLVESSATAVPGLSAVPPLIF